MGSPSFCFAYFAPAYLSQHEQQACSWDHQEKSSDIMSMWNAPHFLSSHESMLPFWKIRKMFFFQNHRLKNFILSMFSAWSWIIPNQLRTTYRFNRTGLVLRHKSLIVANFRQSEILWQALRHILPNKTYENLFCKDNHKYPMKIVLLIKRNHSF
jgi:hypothetical protein